MTRPTVTAVKKVASIGGGPIGAGWAAHFLARGYDVTGYVHSMAEEATYRKVLDTAWISLTALGLAPGASRGRRPHYVQDALKAEAAEVVALISAGARIMVCGGRDMAAGVREALAQILAPTGLTPALLRAEGRYAEDVY